MKNRFILLLFTLTLASCQDRGNELAQWLHEDTGSYGAAISSDNRYLLTGPIAGFGRVWDVASNKVLYSLQHEDNSDGGIIAADFSKDNRFLITAEQQTLARWRVSDGKLLGYWQWPDIRDIAVSADGRYVLIGMKKNQAIYFDMQQGEMVYVFPHHEKINSVDLSADGRFAVTGSDDWHISLWNLQTGEYVWSKNLEYKIAKVLLSDDGELAFANASVGGAKIFKTDTEGSLESELKVKSRGMTVVSADFSDDGLWLATGLAAKAIIIWEVKTGKPLKSWLPAVKHSVQPDSATILAINFNPQKTELLTESSTGIGQLWSLK